ncbi:MAG: murein biosynthesis integral membrane protein MurJ [Clostridia bacterium]|nr:murein biosynthesis integral membrane protein MurJ [Clostridia bacterium]
MNFIATISTLLTVICIVLAPFIIKLIAGGLEHNTYLLAIDLVRITFPMMIFTSLAFSFVGFLQSYGEFNIPAGISGLSNLIVIIFLLFFNEKLGVYGLSYCMVFAWLIQLLIQIPFAKKFGYKFNFFIDFKDPNLKRVFILALPIFISTAVIPINMFVITNFASKLGEGNIATLDYAYKIYLVIYGIFTYAIGNIIFPELSRNSGEGYEEQFNSLVTKGLRLISFLLIPMTVGMIIYSKDIISILYERGSFTAEATINTGSALAFFAIGIIGAGIVEIMNKSFYAKKNTKVPLFVGIVMIALNYVLCLALSNTALTFKGLALSFALVSIANGIVLLTILNFKYSKVITKDLLIYILKIGLATVCMGVLVYAIDFALQDYLVGTMIKNIIRLAIGGGVGVGFYFALAHLLKLNAFKENQ